MNNLSITALLLSFIFNGVGFTALSLFISLFTGIFTLTHANLFGLLTLVTYYLYGLFGMCYVLMSSFTLILCGYMYWYEVNFDDVKKMANQLKEQTIKEQMTTEDDQILKDKQTVNNYSSQLESQLQFLKTTFNRYTETTKVFFEKKLGLTSERTQKLFDIFSKISLWYDGVTLLLYQYLVKIREFTKNTPALKHVYYFYDRLFKYKKGLETLRLMHKLSRQMQEGQLNQLNSFNKIPLHTKQTVKIEKTEKTEKTDLVTDLDKEKSTSFRMPIIPPTMGGDADLSELEEIHKNFNSMPLHEKQKMDEMAMQLFGNMKLNDMVNMMGGLEALSAANANANTGGLGNSGKNGKKSKKK